MPTPSEWERDSTPKVFWTQAVVFGISFAFKLEVFPAESGWQINILDFRAPRHPEIDWEWVDAHTREILARLELGG